MNKLSRRSVFRGSLGLAAAGTLARPYIANARPGPRPCGGRRASSPRRTRRSQMVADYEKASGNTIDYSIVPFAPLMQKIVSALTSGDVPDLISHDVNDAVIVPQNAWNDKIVEVTDVVEAQKIRISSDCLSRFAILQQRQEAAQLLSDPIQDRGVPFHIWSSLVEKGGGKVADAPKTWDAFWDYLQADADRSCATRACAASIRSACSCTTTGPADGNNLFQPFLIANGGNGIVTADGKPHLDDPAGQGGGRSSRSTYIADAYKDGYVPPGALSWNDADDNNAFHSKLMVMDFDGTISTEVALYPRQGAIQRHRHSGPAGATTTASRMPAQLGVGGALIPKGAKNVEVAKEFMKFLIQPKVMNAYLKAGARPLAAAVSRRLVKSDPFWLDPERPAPRDLRRAKACSTRPSVNYAVFNPGWAEVNATQVWGSAEADVIRNGMTPEQAADKALKKIETILAKYPIVQS